MGIKIEDIAFVGFRAPDLAQMRAFMEDFGAVVAQQDETHLFMRGAGEAPFVHMTELGEPGFSMIGLRAEAVADLEKLAAEEGRKVTPLDAPGGGSYIDLSDPDGHAGFELLPASSRSIRWKSANRWPGTSPAPNRAFVISSGSSKVRPRSSELGRRGALGQRFPRVGEMVQGPLRVHHLGRD